MQDPPAAAGQTLVAALERLGQGLANSTLEIHLCPRIAMTAEPPSCAPIRFWAVAMPATREDSKVGTSTRTLV